MGIDRPIQFLNSDLYQRPDCLNPFGKSVQLINLGSRYFVPFDNTFRREVLLTMLRSPVITWPAGLYVNRELAQVQSGSLDLKKLY